MDTLPTVKNDQFTLIFVDILKCLQKMVTTAILPTFKNDWCLLFTLLFVDIFQISICMYCNIRLEMHRNIKHMKFLS